MKKQLSRVFSRPAKVQEQDDESELSKSVRETTQLAETHYENDNFDEALTSYQDLTSLLAKEPADENHDLLIESNFRKCVCLLRLDKPREGLELALEFQRKYEAALGSEDERVLQFSYCAGMLYQDLGKYQDAIGMFKTLVKTNAKLHGGNSRETLNIKSKLACAYVRAEKNEEALSIYEEIEWGVRTQAGCLDFAQILVKKEHAICLRDLGRLSQALEIFEKVKASLWLVNDDLSAVEMLKTSGNIALCLMRKCSFKEALEIYEDVLSKSVSQSGPEHVNTLVARKNLAYCLRYLNRFQEALQMYGDIEGTIIKQPASSAQKASLSVIRTSIAICQRELGDVDGAVEALQTIVEEHVKDHGKMDSIYFDRARALAESYLTQGRYRDAYNLYEVLWTTSCNKYGAEQLESLVAKYFVGCSLLAQSHFPEALTIFEDVLRVQTLKLDPQHWDLLLTRHKLSQCLRQLGKWEQALKLLQSAVLPRLELSLGGSNPRTINARIETGACLAGLGKFSDALEILCQAESKAGTSLRVNHPEWLSANLELGLCHFKMGNHSAALEFLSKVHKLRKEVFGSSHPLTTMAGDEVAKCIAAMKGVAQYPAADVVVPAPVGLVSKPKVVKNVTEILNHANQLYHIEMEQTLAKIKYVPAEELSWKHKSSSTVVMERVKGLGTLDPSQLEAISSHLNDTYEIHRSINERKKTSNGPILGLDLGTSYCCAAYVDISGELQIALNDVGNPTTPSYVCVSEDGSVVVGEIAKNMAHEYPEETIFHIKRLLGKDFSDPYMTHYGKYWPFKIKKGHGNRVVIEIGGKKHRPEELLEHLVAYMKSAGEDATNEDIVNAVVAVPAHFQERQVFLVKQACYRAGLNVLKCVTEPSAASLASCKSNKSSSTTELRRTSLVFDLGGGTFDVSIVEVDKSGSIRVLAIDGDPHLGGEDFDNALMEHCIQHFQQEHGINLREVPNVSEKLRRIKNECEKQKRYLSHKPSLKLGMDSIHDGLHLVVPLDRALLNSLINPYLDKCMSVVDRVLDKAVSVEVHEVVLVGGSTRIPRVQEMLQAKFPGKKLIKSTNPDEAVARGTAIFGAKLKEAEELVRGMSELVVYV